MQSSTGSYSGESVNAGQSSNQPRSEHIIQRPTQALHRDRHTSSLSVASDEASPPLSVISAGSSSKLNPEGSKSFSPRSGIKELIDRLVHILESHFDLNFILTVIDVRDVILPITSRRVAFALFYASILAILIILDQMFDWWSYFVWFIKMNNLILMGCLYGLEPAMVLIIVLVARVPEKRPKEQVTDTNSPVSMDGNNSEEVDIQGKSINLSSCS